MSENLDDLIKMIDRVVEEHCSRSVRAEAELGTWPARVWTGLEELGVPSAMLDESKGGSGLDFASAMLLLRRCAYHACPVPLAEAYVAARLLSGSSLDAPDGLLAIAPSIKDQVLERIPRTDGFLFTGVASAVPWGNHAQNLLVPTEIDGSPMLAILSLGDAAVDTKLNLAGEPRADIRFDRSKVLGCVPSTDISSRLRLEGALCRAVQMVGALERILEFSLQYANDRIQFGRPIGKFQAVQHMLAILAGQVAAATAAVDVGVDASSIRADELAVAVAKSRAGEAACKGTEMAHQVHGAMGFTREHSLHYYTRRLWAWRDEFGGETYWQTRLGRLVAGEGADALWGRLTSLDG